MLAQANELLSGLQQRFGAKARLQISMHSSEIESRGQAEEIASELATEFGVEPIHQEHKSSTWIDVDAGSIRVAIFYEKESEPPKYVFIGGDQAGPV